MKPRTLWVCHPVARRMAFSVAPSGCCSRAMIFVVLVFVPPCPPRAATGLVPRTRLLRRHLPPLCASIGLQVLNALPNPSGSHLPADEPPAWLHARQALPDLHQP